MASRVGHLFPRLVGQSEYNERLKAAAPLMEVALRRLAEHTPGSAELLQLMDATPVGCGQSKTTTQRPNLFGWAGYGYETSHSRYYWRVKLMPSHRRRHRHRVRPGQPQADGRAGRGPQDPDPPTGQGQNFEFRLRAPRLRPASPVAAATRPPADAHLGRAPGSTSPSDPSDDSGARICRKSDATERHERSARPACSCR